MFVLLELRIQRSSGRVRRKTGVAAGVGGGFVDCNTSQHNVGAASGAQVARLLELGYSCGATGDRRVTLQIQGWLHPNP